MGKKQTDVSHSSAESDTCSWSAGLCGESIPALPLWIMKETSSHSDAEENLTVIHYLIPLISYDMVDHVPSNIPEGSVPARLYISDGNKADIRMSIKGRSPNVRHVSPTHRVDLDWLFERIDLDSSLSTRDVRTTEQIASTTTQWMPLLRFFDTHPPFNLNVRPQPFQNHLVLQFLEEHLSRCRTPTALSATSKVDRGMRSR